MEIRYSLTSFLINEVEFESPRVRTPFYKNIQSQYMYIYWRFDTLCNQRLLKFKSPRVRI